jgi:hypothetical protein
MRSPVSASFRSIEWNVAVSRLLRPGQATTTTTTTVVDAAAQEEPLSSHPAHQLLLQQAHFVLPSLPSSNNKKAELRSDWLELIPQRSQRMQTIVACQYTAKSLEQHLRRRQDFQCTTLQSSSLDAADRFLVVGGNEKLDRLQPSIDVVSSDSNHFGLLGFAMHRVGGGESQPPQSSPGGTRRFVGQTRGGCYGHYYATLIEQSCGLPFGAVLP